MTPSTTAHQTPLRGIFLARILGGSPFSLPEYLPDLGSPEPASPAFAGRFFTTEPPGYTHAELLQSCRLCYTMAHSPAGSSAHGFPRQECWRGLPGPPPGGLPDSRTETASLRTPALAGGLPTTHAAWEALAGAKTCAPHMLSDTLFRTLNINQRSAVIQEAFLQE